MRGNMVPAADMLELPVTLATAGMRELIGWRQEVPWIPSGARSALARLLTPRACVLEFGSGMSTLWFARHARSVYSVEHDPEWAELVRRKAERRALRNIALHVFRAGDPRYSTPDADPESFDLVVVDGIQRPECAASAVRLVTPCGAIYIDNTDFGHQWSWYSEAERTITEYATRRKAELRYFTGFPPATVVANQGLLVRFSA